MITSMSKTELYKTLVGHYKPNYNAASDNKKSTEHNVSDKISTDILKNAVNVKNLPVYKELSAEPERDRFVHSEEISYQTYDIGSTVGDNKLEEFVIAYDCTEAIDFMCNNIRTELQSGYANGLVTKERIAEYYGDMAKRLDEAYGAGKFTKDEYDELDEMIEKQIEKETILTERKTAFYAINKKRYSLSPAAAKDIILKEQRMTPDERFAERQRIINEYAEKYCKIDKIAIMELFNSIRYGK